MPVFQWPARDFRTVQSGGRFVGLAAAASGKRCRVAVAGLVNLFGRELPEFPDSG
jgi:hypothetical protein